MPEAREDEVLALYTQLRKHFKRQEDRARILEVSQATISRYDGVAQEGAPPPLTERAVERARRAIDIATADPDRQEREEKEVAAKWFRIKAAELEREARTPARSGDELVARLEAQAPRQEAETGERPKPAKGTGDPS